MTDGAAAALSALTAAIAEIDARMERGFAALADDMPSADDVRAVLRDELPAALDERVPGIVALELRPLNLDIREIGRSLRGLEESYHNLKGITTEVDELRLRIRDIERHLGIAEVV